MGKIERLTPGQEALMREHRDEWLRIGLSTAPADRPSFERSITSIYGAINRKRPIFVLLGSPASCAVGLTLLNNPQVRSQVWSQVGSQVGSQVESQVESQVGSQVWPQVGSQVESQVGSQVWSQVQSQVGSLFGWGVSFWGQWESGWLSFYDFFPKAGVRYGKDEADQLAWWISLAKSCSWWWPGEQVVVVSDRPEKIVRDPETRLHSGDGPAVLFRDGYALYSWHGVTVPAQVIELPHTMNVKQIGDEANAEVRRVMIERFTPERYLREANAKKLNSDDWGTLWRSDLRGDEPLVMVEVRNSTPEPDGSFKDYFLRVPPQTKTAREAVAWTFGDAGFERPDDYAPLVQT